MSKFAPRYVPGPAPALTRKVKLTYNGANSAETLAAMQANLIDFGAILSTLPQNLRDAVRSRPFNMAY